MRKLGAAIFVTLFACACGGEPDLGRDAGRDGSTGQDGSSSVCAADSECDDGLYCNGVERCMPGADGAGANGCVAASSPCGTGEICEEDADRCIPADCAEPDADGDGHDRIGCGAGDDCDDTDGDRYPGNFEVCDPEGHDEDCDPETISAQPDRDGDGYLDAACWNLRADGSENRGTDCDDTRNTVHPNAPESCNGIDDDCDGLIDEGVQSTFYRDQDGDGYGRTDEVMMACTGMPGWVGVPGDCVDDISQPRAASINPGASEACNGIDDDCDGVIDPDCACEDGEEQSCGPTTDVGACRFGTMTCVAGGWGSCIGAVHPSAEICNGADDDCDGLTDDMDSEIASADPTTTGATVYYPDVDGDGFGDGSMPVSRCTPLAGHVTTPGDCNDGNAQIKPGALETCDGVDENCDGIIDNRPGGCDCIDDDTRPCGIDVGACTMGVETCISGAWGSCNGTGPVTETCNEADDDCDGNVDEGLLTVFYLDDDGDSFGDPAVSVSRCSPPASYVARAMDCDDGDRDINPLAAEVCDGVDNNCDGTVDPGCACTGGEMRTCGSDVGECQTGQQTCSTAGEWSGCVGEVRPATETCNGLDDDCDGMTDEGLLRQFWRDADTDGYGDPAMPTMACTAPDGYVANDDDCNDGTPSANPGENEDLFPCDSIDNDCDGRVDETENTAPGGGAVGRMTCYRDADGDTYGVSTNIKLGCTCPAGYVDRAGDCDETGARASLIHPGAGFQTEPHCDGNNTCRTLAGALGCETCSWVGPLYTCVCNPGGISRDYDCDGIVEPEQPSCRGGTGPGGFPTCTGTFAPVATHPASACGANVTYAECGWVGMDPVSCGTHSPVTRPLACR